MKFVKNNKSIRQSSKTIKEEVDEICNEYIKKYSSGFSAEELEDELYFILEDIMVLNCDIDVLKSMIKEPKEICILYHPFCISIISLLLSLVISSMIFNAIIVLANLWCIIYSFKRFFYISKMNKLRREKFQLKKEILYLELKLSVIQNILLEKY